jgi:hypothetical protein
VETRRYADGNQTDRRTAVGHDRRGGRASAGTSTTGASTGGGARTPRTETGAGPPCTGGGAGGSARRGLCGRHDRSVPTPRYSVSAEYAPVGGLIGVSAARHD